MCLPNLLSSIVCEPPSHVKVSQGHRLAKAPSRATLIPRPSDKPYILAIGFIPAGTAGPSGRTSAPGQPAAAKALQFGSAAARQRYLLDQAQLSQASRLLSPS